MKDGDIIAAAESLWGYPFLWSRGNDETQWQSAADFVRGGSMTFTRRESAKDWTVNTISPALALAALEHLVRAGCAEAGTDEYGARVFRRRK